METYHKIQTLFKRDLDGSLTGQKGKMIFGEWTTPELEYLADKPWEFTEKVDGTNIRIGFNYNNGWGHVLFAGRTDNAQIPKPLMEHLEDTFGSGLNSDPRWFRAFSGAGEVTLFGEGYGPKIQGGGRYRKDTSFVLFDVLIDGFWLDRNNVDDIASKMGIDSVPVLGYGTLYDAIEIVTEGYDFLNDEENPGFMRSTWGDFEAEGVVARPVVPLFNRKGERIITKIKAVDFK